MAGPGLEAPLGPALPVRRMRKGTHSCTECRRRKIRCVVTPGASICSHCTTRGIQCIDQGRDTGVSSSNPNAGTGNLGVLSESRESPFSDEPSDIGTSVVGDGHPAPFVSLLTDSELWKTAIESDNLSVQHGLQTPASLIGTPGSEGRFRASNNPSIPNPIAQFSERKTMAVCETLRSSLPTFDSLMSILSNKGAWWNSFRQKTRVISQTPIEGLVPFAARTYTSNNPAELGVLAAAYARSLNKSHSLFEIIDSLVISDFAYASTVEGMECLILLAKSYTDLGQPRRAWLMWRKGMAIAQLMGFHRKEAGLARQMSWWTVYHGDRFTSLLLGLPHGFNDNYYGAVEASVSDPVPLKHQFVHRCAVLAGKVIDRNVFPGKPSVSQTLELDEQMEAIASSMPKSWWTVPDEAFGSIAELDSLRDKLLLQFYFFHVRTYLHLPFIAKSASTWTSNISTLACTEAARQMLRRFLLLRSTVHGACFFECKTSDFVGFTGAVILAIGLQGSVKLLDAANTEEDIRILTAMATIFQKEEQENGCKISSQCRKVLGILLGTQDHDHQATNSYEEHNEILIPYFGIVVPRRKEQNHQSQVAIHATEPITRRLGSTFSTPEELHSDSVNSIIEAQGHALEFPMFEYSGYNLPNPILEGVDFSWNNSSGYDTSSWLDAAMMDLDQDWSSFTDMYDVPSQ